MISSRTITDDDIKRYTPLINRFLRESVIKNWKEASMDPARGEISLGNSGMCMNDFRQTLATEVFLALKNYNPNYKTPTGDSVSELTFIYRHIYFRIGSLMKKLTKAKTGYACWSMPIEEALGEQDREET